MSNKYKSIKILMRLLIIAVPLIVGCKNEKMKEKIEKKKSGLEMILVKGDKYIMGGNDNINDGGPSELRIADECPHFVEVSDFYIGKYEITQNDWIEIMGVNPNKNSDCNDCPVSLVSWRDVQEFIKILNLRDKENYRLPTEEEWEFAAKGGKKSQNYMYSGSNKAEKVAWFSLNSKNKPHPVGTLKPNELGIYDMSGNIWEWCSNYKTPYPCDSIGKKFKSRVLRGGTFGNRVESIRVIDRNGRDEYLRLETLGFRLVKSY